MFKKEGKAITEEMIEKFRKGYEEDLSAKVYTAALAKSELLDVTFLPQEAAKLYDAFSIDLHTSGVMWQKQSGRCWLFAAMNIFREVVAQKCNVERMELSNNYIAFWDKFEKINYYLEAAMECTDLAPSDRTMNWIARGFHDGGQWDMLVGLVKKYGVVPESVMPENAQSCSTRSFIMLLNTQLRKDMIELQNLVKEGKCAKARKEEMLERYFKALCINYGEPPKTFDFVYVDREKNYHADYEMTPVAFYEKYVGINLEDYVSVINAPTKDKPYNCSYTVKYLGNIVGNKVRYLNLSMEELKELAICQLKAGEPVWFGSDCGKYGSRPTGVWDQDSYTYENMFGFDLKMSKAERLDYCDSAMNHAMLLTGVNLDPEGKPDRWKIENSWGPEVGRKGYYVASDKWFDEFTYQIVIHKKYLSEQQIQAFEKEPIELEPWDPMGSLA